MDSSQSHIDRLRELSANEKQIRDFIENILLDECGLVLSHLNVNTLKPWTNEECAGHSHPFLHSHIGDPASYIAYEDSLMATAEYATSQIDRYEITKEPEALVAAAHPIYALLRTLYQGELYEKGFLPKPFGGIRAAAYSHEISFDQYIKVVIALKSYQKYASPALMKVINDYFVAIADYFLARNFIHPRREKVIVAPENAVHAHGLCLYIPILFIAFNITGDSKYRKPIKEGRFDEAFKSLLELASQPFNISSLLIEGFHLAINEGCDDPRLKPIICDQWRKSIERIADDGYGYLYPGRPIKTSRVLRIPSFAPIASIYLPGEKESIFNTALFVLSSIVDPKKMSYVSGDCEYDSNFTAYYYTQCLCETSISSWLMAYWRLKQAAILGKKQDESAD